MKLIDADAFMKELRLVTLSNGTLVNTKSVLFLMEKYPVAYDLESVIRKLDENKKDVVRAIRDNALSDTSMIRISSLEELFEVYTEEQIDIVKSGGILKEGQEA